MFSKLTPNFSPSKVPLPESPCKPSPQEKEAPPPTPAKTPQAPKTPAAVSSLATPAPSRDSPGSNEYNKAFQAQLAKDMGYLKLEKGSPHSSPQTSTPPGQKPKMTIPDIPPFRGKPGKGEPLPSKSARSTPVGQQALPSFSPRDIASIPAKANSQQPLPPLTPSARTQPAPAPTPNSSHASRSEVNENLTALTSVIVPALESALHRRSVMLNKVGHKLVNASQEQQEIHAQRLQVHDQLGKLVEKCVGLFGEIQRVDESAPVGMGGGVVDFLVSPGSGDLRTYANHFTGSCA
jgi:serine/threonine-protein kinase 24/25/MST4